MLTGITLFYIHADITLENLTVVPDSSSSVQLEWKVTPTDGHYCIRNYNIQISGPNGSQWEEEIPGSNHSLNFTGLQLIPFQEYRYCVTANLLHGQIGPKLTVNFTELQGGLKYDKVNFTTDAFAKLHLSCHCQPLSQSNWSHQANNNC